MTIVDPATSIFILLTVIAREKIEVVEDVCARPAEPLKELTHEMNSGRE